MPAFPISIARAAASLCEEIWNSLSGENRGWSHLDRWTLSEPHSQERATFLAAAVYAANSKCRLLHTGCGSLYHDPSRCTRCCRLNGANGGESNCDYCRKADSVILFCTCAYFGRDCNVQPLKDRIQDPWYPINPFTLEPSSVPDRSQQLREIDL